MLRLMRVNVWVAVVVPAIGLALSACSSPEGVSAREPLPKHDVSNGMRAAGLDATLEGNAVDECLRLGTPGGRLNVSWPSGYTMSVNPVGLRDRHGHLVVRVGQTVHAIGGFGESPPLKRCQGNGRAAFYVDAVGNR